MAFDNQTIKVTYTWRQATYKGLHIDLSYCRGVEVLKSGSVSGTACFWDAKTKTKSENICFFLWEFYLQDKVGTNFLAYSRFSVFRVSLKFEKNLKMRRIFQGYWIISSHHAVGDIKLPSQ